MYWVDRIYYFYSKVYYNFGTIETGFIMRHCKGIQFSSNLYCNTRLPYVELIYVHGAFDE